MDNVGLYTKGDKEEVVKRTENIHTMTVFCPIQDESMKVFRTCLITCLNSYIEGNDFFAFVPSPDIFLCFLESLKICKEDNVDVSNLVTLSTILQTFKNLRYINLKFINDKKLLSAYEYLRGDDKTNAFEYAQKIYNIDVLEINLCNLFTKKIVDMLNKVFIFDEIISNSYLEREFLMIFNFEDYISFMEMFTNNAINELDMLDEDIIDYLLLFPKIITKNKPKIRLITNYTEI